MGRNRLLQPRRPALPSRYVLDAWVRLDAVAEFVDLNERVHDRPSGGIVGA
jgi:hypothetical protein